MAGRICDYWQSKQDFNECGQGTAILSPRGLSSTLLHFLLLVNCKKMESKVDSKERLAPCLTAQPERGRQSTAKRAKRAEFIERSETVDGCRSGGYPLLCEVRRRTRQTTKLT